MNEMWKDVVGYEGLYQISNFGRVKSLARYRSTTIGKDRFYKERILKNAVHTNNYEFVILCNDYGHKYYSIHRLVAYHFIENKHNKKYVNHIDSNRRNNKYYNLEWVTSSENILHARIYGSAKFCYIEKPQEIQNIETEEIIKFKNIKELCNFFGKSSCWLTNKRRQVKFPIIVDGWCIY